MNTPLTHPSVVDRVLHAGRSDAAARQIETGMEVHRAAGVQASTLEYLHACPICTGAELRHYCRVPSRFNPGEFIRYERCDGCGVVLRNPRLPAAYRLDRYAEFGYSAEAKKLDRKSQVHYWFMMQVINRLLPLGGGRRLLDLGCGAGGLLVEARAAGFDVMGLELSRDLAQHVRDNLGIPIHQGLVGDQALDGRRFDVITSSQVFEHLLDPRQTLADVRAHLAPGGVILIEVPNLRDIRERIRRGSTMDDSHLFYFNRPSLTRLLKDGGFQVLQVHEGLRPYRFLGDRARRWPVPWMRAAEQALSVCQVKTVLSVVASAAALTPGSQ